MTKKDTDSNLKEQPNSKIDFNLLRHSAHSIRKKYEEIAEEHNPLKNYRLKKNIKN
ncbi:MAG: hypothetical protein GX072_03400 [Lysinibacillus sp.]|nr:hypothetical protein [Lysinibacillus sp.]